MKILKEPLLENEMERLKGLERDRGNDWKDNDEMVKTIKSQIG